MARKARVVLPGFPHHITQRGIRKSDIFRNDQDKGIYKKIMQKHFLDFDVEVLAYCLMDNHVHYICVPMHNESLAKSFGQGHSAYSRYFNTKEGYVGHLFQNRFYSCAMNNDHVLPCIRYVERNPVAAGMVTIAEEYQWSSAAHHCGNIEDTFLANSESISNIGYPWSNFLNRESPDSEIDVFRKNIKSGRPIGDAEFIDYAKSTTGIDFVSKRVGRKSTKKSSKQLAK